MEAKCDHEPFQKFTSLELHIPDFHQIHTMLSPWSQCLEPSGGSTRRRDNTERKGRSGSCGETIGGIKTWWGVGKDCIVWGRTTEGGHRRQGIKDRVPNGRRKTGLD